MKRRQFIKGSMLSAAALAAASVKSHGKESKLGTESNAQIPKRTYGKDGVEISIVGLGGIVIMNAEQEHANRVIAEAFERGVNYYDVAPTYGDAQDRMGPALEPYRKNCFLACKTEKRDREGAEEALKDSLEKLRTDYFDLYQLHGLNDMEKDVDAAFGKGGAMEVLIDAKKNGVARYLGFSAHSTAAALAAMERYDFDSVLIPVNFTCFFKGDFGPRMVEEAQKRGMTILALKAMAKQQWPEDHPQRQTYGKCWYEPVDERRRAELALRFTLSLPVTAAIPPGEESLFRLAMDIAPDFKPITEEEKQQLIAEAESLKPLFSNV